MQAGTHTTLRLQHGGSIREFKDVEVRHPSHKGEPVMDRWELEGIELKVEVEPFNGTSRTRVVEVPVIVGFLPENVLDQ